MGNSAFSSQQQQRQQPAIWVRAWHLRSTPCLTPSGTRKTRASLENPPCLPRAVSVVFINASIMNLRSSLYWCRLCNARNRAIAACVRNDHHEYKSSNPSCGNYFALSLLHLHCSLLARVRPFKTFTGPYDPCFPAKIVNSLPVTVLELLIIEILSFWRSVQSASIISVFISTSHHQRVFTRTETYV